jgi:hypothetical protein
MKFEYLYKTPSNINSAQTRPRGQLDIAKWPAASFFQVAGSLVFFQRVCAGSSFACFRNVFAQRRDKQKRLFAVRNYLLGTECLIPVTFLTPVRDGIS